MTKKHKLHNLKILGSTVVVLILGVIGAKLLFTPDLTAQPIFIASFR
jgi:hypothetical protein